jgi:hypothetical protein
VQPSQKLLTILTAASLCAACGSLRDAVDGRSTPEAGAPVANSKGKGKGGSTVGPTSPVTGNATDKGGASFTPGEKSPIQFRGSAGDNVPGYLWVPPGISAGKKMPAALIMYGLGGDKDDGTIAKAAGRLNASGIIAMTIDWPGTGDRGTITNAQRILGQGFEQTVGDYRLAFDYLAANNLVDSARLGYAGASWGADTGLAFAASDPRVKAFVAIVPVPNPLLGTNAPNLKIKQIAPRPLLCIFIEGGVDLSQTVCNDGKAATTELFGFKNVDHNLSTVRDEVGNQIAQFLVKKL